MQHLFSFLLNEFKNHLKPFFFFFF